MQAVVPAAGEGTRLRPLTEDKPKGLVDVGGKPILTHCFDELLALEVAELVVVIGYRGEQIVDHYGDAYEGVPITYARQSERKGLAHALLQAAPHVESEFAVMNGDNVLRANLSRVVNRLDEDVAGALLVDRVSHEEARETGVIGTDDAGRVVAMVEKPDDPPSTLVSTGFYAFNPAIIEACRAIDPSARGEYELSDAIDRLVARGATVETVPLEGWWVNVNAPCDVERAERWLARE